MPANHAAAIEGRFDDVEEENHGSVTINYPNTNVNQSYETSYPNLLLKPLHIPKKSPQNIINHSFLVHAYDWTEEEAPNKLYAAIDVINRCVTSVFCMYMLFSFLILFIFYLLQRNTFILCIDI